MIATMKKLIFFILIVTASAVYAHKVNIFAYVDGNKVITESYFNDGKKCRRAKIEVFNSKTGKKLREGTTDTEGIYSFYPAEPQELKFILTAHMGHRAEYILSREEMEVFTQTDREPGLHDPATLTGCAKKQDGQSSTEQKQGGISETQVTETVNRILDKKLQPLYIRLRRLEKTDRPSATDIIGGIGFIFGIAGIIFYIKAKNHEHND